MCKKFQNSLQRFIADQAGNGEDSSDVFIPRTTAPAADDLNQIKTTYNGYNYCTLQDEETGSVLPNCTGYAQGRWRELLGAYHYLSRGHGGIQYINTEDGYSRGQTPKLGAVICQHKIDGGAAGHVEIVEKIESNGDIWCSRSAYKGDRFGYHKIAYPYLKEGYEFQGFIYIPKEYEPAQEFEIGNSVIVNGPLFNSIYGDKQIGYADHVITTITRKHDKGSYPYNTTGDLGWVSADSLTAYTPGTYIIQVSGADTDILNMARTKGYTIYKIEKEGDN